MADIKVDDGKLYVEAGASENPKPSSSGKTLVLYSTHGFINLPDGSMVSINWCKRREE